MTDIDPGAENAVEAPERVEIYDALLSGEERTPELLHAIATAVAPLANEHDATIILSQSAAVGADGMPRGFVLRTRGTTPLTGRDNPFVSERTGRGLSWFVLERPAISDAELRRSVAEQPLARPPSLVKMTPYVIKSTDGLSDAPEYLIVVHGNDVVAARELLNVVEQRAVSGQPMTVHDLAQSHAYADVTSRSIDARAQFAELFAHAHKLTIRASANKDDNADDIVDDEHAADIIAAGIVQTHSIVSPARFTNGNEESAVYDVYDNVVEPTSARSGVPMFEGAYAGFEMLRGAPTLGANGKVSRAIHPTVTQASDDDELPPMLHANTGIHASSSGDKHRAALSTRLIAVHQSQSDTAAKRAIDTLHSLGPVPDVNPYIERRYNTLDDDAGVAALSKLGISLTGTSAVSRRRLRTIVAEVPGLDTVDMPHARLEQVVRVTGVKSVPVRIDGDIVSRLQRNWPTVKGRQNETSRLGKVLKDERKDGTVPVSTAVLRALFDVEAERRQITDDGKIV